MSRYRPELHYTAKKGWINDPNGFCFFNGTYHIFTQHNPHSTQWGQMHWGHAISKDLSVWEEQPIALYPDQWYEDDPQGGCFSGSAIVIDDILYLYYTAAANGVQRQCVATSRNGVVFTKAKENPILEPPQGITDFRDPKVFTLEDRLFMVIGSSNTTEHAVLLYEGSDPFTWTKRSVLYTVPKELGTMPECPDFFPLGEKWVLVFSPIGEETPGVIAVVGTFDLDTYAFEVESLEPIDYGSHYYAFQSTNGKDNERYAFAWAGQWPWMGRFSGYGPASEGWRGFLTFPRILTLEEGKIYSYPVEEVRQRFSHLLDYRVVKPSEDEVFEDLPPVYLLRCEFTSGFSISFGSTQLRVDPTTDEAILEHRGSMFTAPIKSGPVEIFVDHMSVEIYFGGGYSSICFNSDEPLDLTSHNEEELLELTLSGLPPHH